MVTGQHPSAITTKGWAGATSVHSPGRQLTVLVAQMDPVLTPRFWRRATKAKSGQDCGWNR